MSKDFLGNELQVGDHVIFTQEHYRNLTRGKIVKMGLAKSTIKHKENGLGNTLSICYNNQVVKIFISKNGEKNEIRLLEGEIK